MKKTPIKIFVAPSARMVAEARVMRLKVPLAQPMEDPPVRMVNGAPGSDEAKRDAKKRLADAGLVVRSVNHTPENTLLAYVAHDEDVTNPLPAPGKPAPVPRKVR